MASSKAMEVDDSFRARVDKVFGSLASSKSSPAWSLTDDEIERREWRRDTDTSDRDETPCSSSFDGFLPKDRKVSRRNRRKEFEVGDGGDEEDGDDGWEIRSSIGLDPTLDREDEEDEFDKVASGRENAGDRMYMRNVSDHGDYLNSHNVLPKTKDPRANHLAAKIRLKEDEDEAEKSRPSKANVAEAEEPHVEASENGSQPKSILKRKDRDTDFKSRKRVKFNSGLTDAGETQDAETPSETSIALQNETAVAQNTNRVPDYILNPSNYKHYTFDTSTDDDVSNKTNTEACMGFLKLVQRSKATELDHASAEYPKSVTFIPKKKGNSSEVKQHKEGSDTQSTNRTGYPVGIAAGEVEQDETSAMDEDVPETEEADKGGVYLQKPSRRFRNPSRSDD